MLVNAAARYNVGGLKNKSACPYSKADWLSKLTFWWMNPLFKAGKKRALTEDNLYDIVPTDDAALLSDRLERAWQQEIEHSQTRGKEPNLFKTVLCAFKHECLYFGIFLFLSESLRILQPYLIGKLIGYFQPGSSLSPAAAYCIAAALGISGLLRLLFDPWHFFQAHYLALRMKAAVGGLIYRKVLKISSLSLHKTTSGQIINYLATDLDKFNFTTETFHFIWAAPLEILVIMIFIYQNIGVAGLFMVPVFVCVLPIQFYLGRLFGKLRMKIASRTDRRIHMMSEIIVGMRVIKMYCWEKPFGEVIAKIRRSEINQFWFATMAKVLNGCLYMAASRLLSVPIFVAAWQMNVPLSSVVVFSVVGWVEILKFTVFLYLFFFVENNVQLYSSLKRIKHFLVLEEMVDMTNNERRIIHKKDPSVEYSLNIDNMTAVWSVKSEPAGNHTQGSETDEQNIQLSREVQDMSEVFTLKNIDIKVKAGELIAIVGTVGSGKSSLLMTVLGELPAKEGNFTVCGTIGYVSQQPWVVTGTVKDNILFGENYDEMKYRTVVNVCALDKDIELMSHGDQTLVGERGLVLSGGQKARITLARAVYKDADIYLLDDPLGVVDTEVGKHLFNKCICEYLGKKTRILVTHQLQYLQTVDKIIALKEGTIVSVGRYEDLLTSSRELSKILSNLHSSEDEGIGQEEGKTTKTIKDIAEKDEDAEEDLETGTVDWRVYRYYIASGYPIITVPALLILILLTQSSFIFSDWHLAKWAEYQDNFIQSSKLSKITDVIPNVSTVDCSGIMNCQSSNMTSYDLSLPVSKLPLYNLTTPVSPASAHDDSMYMYTFIVSMCVYIVAAVVMSVVFFTTLIIAGKRLHDKMFRKVIGAKTRFFDCNPVGRILNRFARDIGLIDDLIPRYLYVIFEIGFRLLGMVIATCVINPLLLLPLCPLVVIIILIRNYAVNTTRHLKRIESVTKSPIYSHLSDTLHGLPTIRALRLNKDFIMEFDTFQNRHTAAAFLFLCSFRWLSIRSLFGVVIYFICVVMLSLILKDVIGLSGGLYGLSLSYVALLADPFEYFIRQTAEVETYMTSVERITAYTKLEQEAEKYSDNTPPTSWPKEGEIHFKNVFLRYSAESPIILKNINCIINGKKKVGIVGRTGAGKSSLLASLLRLAEPYGCILIDNVNILTIGLHELRSKISVIPQDPILFSGTLRRNLDPFEEYNDEQLWNSLEQVQLKQKVEGIPGMLYAEMAEGGKNFSVGQRQLVCLARAVLHYNRILILDEATANVDHKTDELIQKTIRERFQDCTVLTVAHRLHTIMDSDRVMVLDNGELKEFDIPYKLLQVKEGYLRRLVEQTGKAQVQQLQAVALESYQQKAGLNEMSTNV